MTRRLILCLAVLGCSHPSATPPVARPGAPSHDSTTRDGYELVFINKDPALDPALRARLIETFFQVYPAEVAQYNPASLTKVTFVMDPDYQGVAETDAGVVRFNPAWFHKHPNDLDVVTHEVMHIVQAYPPDSGPGWVTEGIADYVRYRLGVDNAGAGWSLPPVTADHDYSTSYRVTARFFVWLEAKRKPGLVKTLDAAMRAGNYRDAIWAEQTGKPVAQLWTEYVADPALP